MKTVVTKHEHQVWGKISDVNHSSLLQLLEQELWESHVMVRTVWTLSNWAHQVVVTPLVPTSSCICCFLWFLFQTSCWYCFTATVAVFVCLFVSSLDLLLKLQTLWPGSAPLPLPEKGFWPCFGKCKELVSLWFMRVCPSRLCCNHDKATGYLTWRSNNSHYFWIWSCKRPRVPSK